MAKGTSKKTGTGAAASKGSKVSAVVREAARLANEPATQKIIAAGLLTAAAALTTDERLRRFAREAQDAAFEGAGLASKNVNIIGAAIISAATEAARRALQGGGGGARASANQASPEGETADQPKAARKPRGSQGGQARRKAAGTAGQGKPKAKAPAAAGSGSSPAKASTAKKPRGRAAKAAPGKKAR